MISTKRELWDQNVQKSQELAHFIELTANLVRNWESGDLAQCVNELREYALVIEMRYWIAGQITKGI